jgi:protease I
MAKILSGKKIAMIIAFRAFQDEEYFIPKEIFETNGAEVITASDSPGTAIGTQGGDTKVDVLIGDINIDDFQAVLFIGGSGAQEYIEDEDCHGIAREAVEKDKVLGAICIAPAILARAGVLKKKKATVWSSAMDKSAIKILKVSGAIYQEEPVVVDGKIITASGPAAAEEFANKIIGLLK